MTIQLFISITASFFTMVALALTITQQDWSLIAYIWNIVAAILWLGRIIK